jgi:HK97 family phage major capsid protein
MPRPLNEEHAAIKEEALNVVRLARKEERELTGEEEAANKLRFAAMDRIKKSIVDEQKFAQSALPDVALADAIEAAIANPANSDAQQTAVKAAQHFTNNTDMVKFEAARKEVNQYLWEGPMGQKFTLITTSGSSVMLPSIPAQPVVIRRIQNPILAALASMGMIPLYTAGTGTVPVPVFDDTSNDASVAAGSPTNDTGSGDSQTAASVDPTATGLTLGAKLYDSKAIWLSNTLLDAVGYDLLGYVEPILQRRVDHKQHALWVAALATLASQVGGVAGKVTASKAAVTSSELLAWEHSLPIAYRSDRVYIFSDSLLQTVRGLTDTQGRFLYQESLRDDTPDKFFGAPLFLTDALGAIGTANAVVGAVVSAESLKVRICTNRRLARYVNIPNYQDQIGLELFVNGDFAFVNQGCRLLQNAAT